MLVGTQCQHATARRAADETLLQQVGLDDLLQRIARLRERRRERFNADRSAVVMLGDAGEIAMIEGIEPLAVDFELPQRPIGHLAR